MIEQVKPPLAELAHSGVKGMKWGVRKPEDRGGGASGGTTRSGGTSSGGGATGGVSAGGAKNNHATAKKVAIGVGVAGLVVGGGFVAYKMRQSGGLRIDPSNGMELLDTFSPATKTKVNDLVQSKTMHVPVVKIIKPPKFKTPSIQEQQKIFDDFMNDPKQKSLKEVYNKMTIKPSDGGVGSAGKGTSRFVDKALEDAMTKGGRTVVAKLKRKKKPEPQRGMA